MSARNTYRYKVDNTFLHIYSRANNKVPVFINQKYFDKFLDILLFLLTTDDNLADSLRLFSRPRKPCQNFSKNINLVSFCIMNNHYHLIIYIKDSDKLPKFMHLFHRKLTQIINSDQNKVGHLMQSRYKSRPILSEVDLLNVSAYIQLNPNEIHPQDSNYYLRYPFSSLNSTHMISKVVSTNMIF
ncbi:transposase [Candidatus Saccharibacteria bacterium]|nr:transposase [Candidatus Saccharibacteria bacterium]MCB9835007.1 transposase [Candidatus Nomurabacteria bacterium]